VDETVTTKRSQKAKQPPSSEDPSLDEGEQGKDGEGDEKRKGKRGGRGTKREVFTLPGLIHMDSMESMESLLAEASANLLFHGHHGFHVE